MYRNLGDKFERWQIYFDRPVALDDCNSLNYLAELASQYVEELYESDDNKMNKLIEQLLKENWPVKNGKFKDNGFFKNFSFFLLIFIQNKKFYK